MKYYRYGKMATIMTAMLAVAVIIIAPVQAGTIDFEDLDIDENVFNQYTQRGVTFPQIPRINEPLAGTQSGTKALIKQHHLNEFDGSPLIIEFTALQNAVSMYAGTNWERALTWDAELTAYDNNGNLVAQDAVSLPAGPASIHTLLSVSTNSRIIRKVELLYAGSAFENIDDLTFSHEESGVSEDTTPPQVFILTPIDGQHLDSFTTGMLEFPLDGYVIEDILLKTLTIDVEGSDGQTNHGNLTAHNGPQHYDFNSPHLHGLIFEGQNRITVTAEDFGGNVGTATVEVTFKPLEGEAELLILYPEELRAPLPLLKAWKDLTGIPTGLVSLEAINVDPRFSGYYDLPEKIKRAIAYAYDNHGTRYVMLMGDADKFPVRYNRLGKQGVSWGVVWYASDLYYADLFDEDGNFDDWDQNGNHVYGEWWSPDEDGVMAPNFATINMDGADLRPDVAIGRVPASTRLEAINYIAKSFGYELNYSGNWFTNTILFNGDKDWSNDHQALDWVIQNTLSGFNNQKCYRPSNYESMSSVEKSAALGTMRQCVLAALNQGVGFGAFFGHGAPLTMGNVLNGWDVPTLTEKTRLPVFFARTCDTAKFNIISDIYEDINGNLPVQNGWNDPRPEPKPVQPTGVDNESMAEALLVKSLTGAVGFVGAHSGTNLASIPISQKFFESWDAGYHRMGDMWNQAVAGFANDYLYSSNWIGKCPFQSHHIHKYMLFGDPSLRLGGIPEEDLANLIDSETEPEELLASIQVLQAREVHDFRNLSYPRFTREETISLKGETQGHGLVRLYQGRSLLAETQADKSGQFRIELPELEEGNHTLALSLANVDRSVNIDTIIRIGVYRHAPEAKNVEVCDVCDPRQVLVTGETQYDSTMVILTEEGKTVGIANSRHGGRFEIRASSVLDDGEYIFALGLRDAAGNVTEVPGTIQITIACKGDGCEPNVGDSTSSTGIWFLFLLAVVLALVLLGIRIRRAKSL